MMGALFWSIFGRRNAEKAKRANAEIERAMEKQRAEQQLRALNGASLTGSFWVRNGDMNPYCNIAGRKWRSEDGKYAGVYGGYGDIPDDAHPVMWEFRGAPLGQAAGRGN